MFARAFFLGWRPASRPFHAFRTTFWRRQRRLDQLQQLVVQVIVHYIVAVLALFLFVFLVVAHPTSSASTTPLGQAVVVRESPVGHHQVRKEVAHLSPASRLVVNRHNRRHTALHENGLDAKPAGVDAFLGVVREDQLVCSDVIQLFAHVVQCPKLGLYNLMERKPLYFGHDSNLALLLDVLDNQFHFGLVADDFPQASL